MNDLAVLPNARQCLSLNLLILTCVADLCQQQYSNDWKPNFKITVMFANYNISDGWLLNFKFHLMCY